MEALFDGGGGGVGSRRSKTDIMYLFVALTFAIFFFHPVSRARWDRGAGGRKR